MRFKSSPENWQPREPAPVFDRGRYPAPLVTRVAAAWHRLCADERESLIAATSVTADLARLGAPPAIMSLGARVIADEIRHVEVCLRVLGSLGADGAGHDRNGARENDRDEEGVSDDDDGTAAALGGTAASASDALERRAARVLVARFAVGESLSAACLASARAKAREPIIAWGFTELLRDEARHGAFGAQAGAWVIRDWTAGERQALWPDCVRQMESFERRIGGPVMAMARAPFRRDTAADALGLMTPEASCGAIIASIPRWVLPHLSPLGVIPPASEAPSLLQ